MNKISTFDELKQQLNDAQKELNNTPNVQRKATLSEHIEMLTTKIDNHINNNPIHTTYYLRNKNISPTTVMTFNPHAIHSCAYNTHSTIGISGSPGTTTGISWN